MYRDRVTGFVMEKVTSRLTPLEQRILDVLDDIFIELICYDVLVREEMLQLLSTQISQGEKNKLQFIIAARLDKLVENSNFLESAFNPWCETFERREEIEDYINDRDFWDSAPPQLRKKRGVLRGIVGAYSCVLKNKSHVPNPS